MKFPSPLLQGNERLDHLLLSLLESIGPGVFYQGKLCKPVEKSLRVHLVPGAGEDVV